MFQIRSNLYLSLIEMKKSPNFNFTDGQQSTLISSYFYGYTGIMIFSGYFVAKFGPKFVCVGGLVLSAITSIVFPWLGYKSLMKDDFRVRSSPLC